MSGNVRGKHDPITGFVQKQTCPKLHRQASHGPNETWAVISPSSPASGERIEVFVFAGNEDFSEDCCNFINFSIGMKVDTLPGESVTRHRAKFHKVVVRSCSIL